MPPSGHSRPQNRCIVSAPRKTSRIKLFRLQTGRDAGSRGFARAHGQHKTNLKNALCEFRNLFRTGQRFTWQVPIIRQRKQVAIELPASLQDGVAAMKAVVSVLLALSVLAGIAAPAIALDANALDGKTSLVAQDRLVF